VPLYNPNNSFPRRHFFLFDMSPKTPAGGSSTTSMPGKGSRRRRSYATGRWVCAREQPGSMLGLCQAMLKNGAVSSCGPLVPSVVDEILRTAVRTSIAGASEELAKEFRFRNPDCRPASACYRGPAGTSSGYKTAATSGAAPMAQVLERMVMRSRCGGGEMIRLSPL
jgi:hypothetical protein